MYLVLSILNQTLKILLPLFKIIDSFLILHYIDIKLLIVLLSFLQLGVELLLDSHPVNLLLEFALLLNTIHLFPVVLNSLV